ncbi:MAG: hypothetical protein H7A40_05965 [Chlamydiales bacterium]|nr:hypothetical protein [Chlamydiales bacterium]
MSTPTSCRALAELSFNLLKTLGRIDQNATLSEAQQRFSHDYVQKVQNDEVPPAPKELTNIRKHCWENAAEQAKKLHAAMEILSPAAAQQSDMLERTSKTADSALQGCMIAEAINDLLKSPDYQARFNFPAAAEKRGACMHAQDQSSGSNILTGYAKMKAFHQEVMLAVDQFV